MFDIGIHRQFTAVIANSKTFFSLEIEMFYHQIYYYFLLKINSYIKILVVIIDYKFAQKSADLIFCYDEIQIIVSYRLEPNF